MKKLLFVPCLLLVFLFFSCSRSESTSGYGDVETLYRESLTAMKSLDREVIAAYVKKLLPDNGTTAYMKKHGCLYRGYPKGMEKYPDAIDKAVADLTETLYSYALQLKQDGVLDDLELFAFRAEGEGSLEECGCPEILITEQGGIFVSKQQQDTIGYRLGELLKIDGVWKTFTRFRTF